VPVFWVFEFGQDIARLACTAKQQRAQPRGWLVVLRRALGKSQQGSNSPESLLTAEGQPKSLIDRQGHKSTRKFAANDPRGRLAANWATINPWAKSPKFSPASLRCPILRRGKS
jgi:hypothetical protein